MIIRFKHFHDRLNVIVTLAHEREFFSAKCAQFPLTFTQWNWMKVIISPELWSFIFEINIIKKWIPKFIQMVYY